MSEASEIIDKLEDSAMARLASISTVPLTTRQALSIVRAYRQQESELTTLRAQIKRAEEQEPVGYEARFLDTSPHTVSSGQWSEWERVEPRNPHTETFKDRAAEIQAYIDAGFSYQLRGLYAEPKPAPVGVPQLSTKMLKAAKKADMDHGDFETWMEMTGGNFKRMFSAAMLAAAPQPKENSHD